MQPTELDIPADPEFVALARLVVGAVAGDRYDLSNEQIDNLKLAISEACTLAMRQQTKESDRRISLYCTGSDDYFEVTVDGRGKDFLQDNDEMPAEHQLDRKLQEELGLPFIGSLVDETEVHDVPTGNALRMTIFANPSEGS